MMKITLGCFKSYDVRGCVPKQLNPETAYRIGRAFDGDLDGGICVTTSHNPEQYNGIKIPAIKVILIDRRFAIMALNEGFGGRTLLTWK